MDLNAILPLDPTTSISDNYQSDDTNSKPSRALQQRSELQAFKNVFYLKPKIIINEDSTTAAEKVILRRNQLLLQEYNRGKDIRKSKMTQISDTIPICKGQLKQFDKILEEKTQNLEELYFRANIYKEDRAREKVEFIN